MTTASIPPTSKANVALEIVETFKTKIDDPKIAFHPNIPNEMMEKVTTTYAKTAKENDETILCVLNETVFAGNATDGFVLTEQAIYWHNIGEPDGMVPLSEITEIVYEKGLLVKLLKINGKHKILTTTPKPQSMELVVELVQALRSGHPAKTGTDEQQTAKPNQQSEPAQKKERSELTGTKKQSIAKKGLKIFAAFFVACFLFVFLAPKPDGYLALQAVTEAMTKKQINPEITRYCFTPSEPGKGIILIENNITVQGTDKWLGYAYYGARIEISGSWFWKTAKVVTLDTINRPTGDQLKWEETELGKRQSEEDRNRVMKMMGQ